MRTSDGTVLAAWSGDDRVYPEGGLACQLVGIMGAPDVSQGVEETYAENLEDGANVTLSIDSNVQRAAEEALGGRTGSVVVMDAGTGAVLAMASAPSCDLNEAAADDARALENGALIARIPGSTFKTITYAAAIESGSLDSDQVFDAPAYLIFPEGEVVNADAVQYGMLPLHQAYALSVNTVFSQVGIALGTDVIVDQAARFGFGADILRDLPCDVSEISGADDLNVLERAWCGTGQALYRSGSGPFGPQATVLQMAVVSAAIANGGTVVLPYVVDRIDRADGSAEEAETETLGEPAVSEATAEAVADGMREAVLSGTATRAYVEGADVAGKTGTAEVYDGSTDGWFSGFATADGEALAVTTVLANAKSSEACELAAEVITALREG